MAYTLKTTGIATSAKCVVAIDEDGSTITEFVSSTVDANKTATNVTTGTGSWKSTTRGYFTLPGDSSNNIIKFASGHRPSVNDGTGFSCFVAFHSLTNVGGDDWGLIERGGTSFWLRIKANETLVGLDSGLSSSTSIPTGGTKSSIGHVHKASTTTEYYYGLESGSLAADGSRTDPGFGGGTYEVSAIGNDPSGWYIGASIYCVAIFEGDLALADFQSLHDDWFGTLFDTGGGSSTTPLIGGLTHGILTKGRLVA